jgi:hypothetical protein
MKKIIYLFLAIIIIQIGLLFSCTKTITDECGPFPNRFIINGLNISSNKLVSFDSLNNYYQFDSISLIDTLTIDNFFIELNPVKEYYIAKSRISGISIINEAFACSPPTPFSEATIDNISIFCDKDYDSSFKIGVDLKMIFDVVVVDYYKYINYY